MQSVAQDSIPQSPDILRGRGDPCEGAEHDPPQNYAPQGLPSPTQEWQTKVLSQFHSLLHSMFPLSLRAAVIADRRLSSSCGTYCFT